MLKTGTCLCSDPELSFVFKKNCSWQEQVLPALATHGVEWILWILKDFFVQDLGKKRLFKKKKDGLEFSLDGQIHSVAPIKWGVLYLETITSFLEIIGVLYYIVYAIL